MSAKSKLSRCPWVPEDNDVYIAYHDNEWGNAVHDDRIHFEFLILEAAQAGLSWLTILKRRNGYRRAFADFDPKVVAEYDQNKIEELMRYEGIIRNRLKILSSVNNARKFLEIQKEFGSFDSYIWQFVGGKTLQHHCRTMQDIPDTSKEAEALSKDLRKRGFTFVGPKVIYAHMQATGLVNDHTQNCFKYLT